MTAHLKLTSRNFTEAVLQISPTDRKYTCTQSGFKECFLNKLTNNKQRLYAYVMTCNSKVNWRAQIRPTIASTPYIRQVKVRLWLTVVNINIHI